MMKKILRTILREIPVVLVLVFCLSVTGWPIVVVRV